MILVGFGSNSRFCGVSRDSVITMAARAISVFAPIKQLSTAYASPSWPDPSDPPYINRAAILEAEGPPEKLMMQLLAVERAFGRDRGKNPRKNAPRTLDLDLLAFDDRVLIPGSAHPDPQGLNLHLPHPHLSERDFVLSPIAEIAPDWRHPQTGQTAEQMRARIERTAARVAVGA